MSVTSHTARTATHRALVPSHAAIMASSRDAGNESMRRACRKAWNEEDRAAAQAVVDRLLPYYLADAHLRQIKGVTAEVPVRAMRNKSDELVAENTGKQA